MRKYWKYICIGLAILIIVLFYLFYPRLKIQKPYIEINVNEKYKDPGVKAYNIFHNFKKRVKTKSNLNTKKIGLYQIKYSYKYLFIEKSIIRSVNVVDKEKPVIELDYDDKEICKNKYKEYKYKATDNYDGDLTDKVEVKLENDKLIYTVLDSSNNKAIITKDIKIKTDNKPILKLKGNTTLTIYKGSKYKESGYTAKDECDGKLTDKVRVSGKVDTGKVATYKITYTVYNSNENKTSVTRTIKVIEKPKVNNVDTSAKASNGGGKVVYLTFDDGPGLYTQNILNTLSKYNVKATFFVTNQFPKYQYLIAEEAKRGHVVAVHTYSHNYNVYNSVDTYVNDFNKMNEIIKNHTGSYSKIFRFPGGSSNTISRRYSAGVVSRIASTMTSKGYVYFDWNISSGDAAGYSSSKIYSAVINGVGRCGSTCVVLMHDINGKTASALDPILSELTKKNYNFGTLSTSTPTVHHKIVN